MPKVKAVPVLKIHAMKMYGAVEVQLHIFLSHMEVSGQLQTLTALSLRGKPPSAHWINQTSFI